jgi:hypothetical protein
MGIVHRSNNRVLPNNSRAVDVAHSSLARIAPVQARRYDAAFQVNGYNGILYHRMSSGYRCRCTNQSEVAASRLDIEGKADSGLISSLLTGQEFGVRPYGSVAATTIASKNTMLEIVPIDYQTARIGPPPLANSTDLAIQAALGLSSHDYITGQLGVPIPVNTPSLYDMDVPSAGQRIVGTFSDMYSSDPDQAGATTIVESGSVPGGPVATTEEIVEMEESGRHNPGGYGYTDAACPVCFGTGFVGGFNVHMGWRRVLVPYEPQALIPPDATLDLQDKPPSLECDLCEWIGVRLPLGVVSVDSLRVYQDDRLVVGASVQIDNFDITSDIDLVSKCDGGLHNIRVTLPTRGKFSHLEIQVNQSTQSANFEFPRLSKNSNTSLLERTDPFQVVFSPLIPLSKHQRSYHGNDHWSSVPDKGVYVLA